MDLSSPCRNMSPWGPTQTRQLRRETQYSGRFLERRWSSRRFPYGYLVTTSPQSLTRPW